MKDMLLKWILVVKAKGISKTKRGNYIIMGRLRNYYCYLLPPTFRVTLCRENIYEFHYKEFAFINKLFWNNHRAFQWNNNWCSFLIHLPWLWYYKWIWNRMICSWLIWSHWYWKISMIWMLLLKIPGNIWNTWVGRGLIQGFINQTILMSCHEKSFSFVGHPICHVLFIVFNFI